MKEKELQLARLQQVLPRSDLSDDLLKMPKLPPFRDGDGITSYFIRFERMADMFKWPKVTWATRVGLLFQGHAMKIYSSLPPAITEDYAQLKSAILRAYRRTPDQYRQDFRQAKIGDHENYTQFLVTLPRLFDYWYDSLDYEKTFEDMKNLVIGNQFISTVPTDIRMFIKERKTLDPKEMARLADDFATVHKCYPRHSQKGSKGSSSKGSSSKADQNKSEVKSDDVKKGKPRKCFSCGSLDHFHSKCPRNQAVDQSLVQYLPSMELKSPVCYGTVNGIVSLVLRDTGCSGVIVAEELYLI